MAEVIKFVTFVNTNVAAISLIVAILGGLFGWIKFREYIKDKRFKTYHRLIDELVDNASHASGNLMLDRQIAITFELRNFPKYYRVTSRILEGLRESWRGSNPRLLNEIDLTLDYIKSNRLFRLFKK